MTQTVRLLSSSSLSGDDVVNREGENLGKIEDLMLDLSNGEIEYAVLSFGGFLGLGDSYFAIPWQAFDVDAENKRLILNVEKERLKDAEGFDKDNWPNMADPSFRKSVYQHYGFTPRHA